MLKIRIVHKGLLLVAVPLFFGSAFISLLFFGLQDLDRLVQREHRLKDAISCHMTALRCAAAANRLASSYNFSELKSGNPGNPGNPDNPGNPGKNRTTDIAQVREAIWQSRLAQVISDYRNEAAEFDEHIRLLLKDEPALLESALKSSSLKLVNESSTRYVADSPFLQELLQASQEQTKSATDAMNSLRTVLYGGMVAGVIVSILLVVYFCLNITNRLLIILQNTVCLSKGKKLSPPLKGDDEISELDQFLFKSATEIKELERFKQEMIGVVSHELKSPLSSIGGFLASLKEGVYGALPAKAQKKAERTYTTVKRLMGLVADLLYLDRLELEIKPQEIFVDELLAASVDSVKELSEQSGFVINVKSQGGKIFADRDRLVQVIVNLLSNAMKFSPAGAEISLVAIQHKDCFECRVSDKGDGISEEFQKQIFEPFNQVNAKDGKKGTGLGLTISRTIVEKQGGVIGVDSEPGKGSTFWFKIPSSESAALLTNNFPAASKNPILNRQELLKAPAELKPQSKPQRRKFSVLQQGFVIISVPLVFQLSFACLIHHSLNQIEEQIQREQNSKEILNTLNHGAELYYAAMFAFSNKNPESWKRCLDDKERVFAVLDKVEKLCSGDPEELKDSKESRARLKIFYASLQKLLLQMGSLNKAADSEQSRQAVNNLTSDPATVKEIYPLFEAQRAEERLMLRERAIGESLGAQRVQMMKNLEAALLWGFLLNFVLSVFLAAFIMRKLRIRLAHVMENTARLVSRKKLDPPISGGDEIAYLDRELYEAGNHLLELEKFKQELISIVSHELRTPLMSISASLQLFDQSNALGDFSDKGVQRLKIACEEADRLIRLINNLLDIEKMEAGKFILDCSEIEIAALLEMAVSSIVELAEAKGIRLHSYLESPGMKVYADRDRLCQVLINLVSNAIKFSPENESIELRVTEEKNGQDLLVFSVIDRGRGIPEDRQAKIFARFVQVEKSDATERGGSGLGLAISKAIIQQHGGSIGLESKIGQGSRFWFKLPMDRSCVS